MESNEFVRTYLSKINKVPFLPKKVQKEIGFKIKENEIKILECCTEFTEFRNQLKHLKVILERNPNNIFKLSKNIDENSPKKDVIETEGYFSDLFLNLENEVSLEQTVESLKKVNLTSSTINQILEPIKAKFKTLVDYNFKLKRILNLLEIKDRIELEAMEREITNPKSSQNISRKLFLTESKLINYINEAKEYLTFIEAFKTTNTAWGNFKDLHAKLIALEAQASEQRNILIESHLALVVHRAKRFMNQGLDFEELVQEGNLGLIKAVDKYDPSKDIKVTTYAVWWIDLAIRRAILNKAKTVRIPIHINGILQVINNSYHRLVHQLGREPKHEEIAKDTKLKLKVIQELYTAAQHEIGIEEEISPGVSISDIIPDEGNGPSASVANSILQEQIRMILSKLSVRDEKIIRLRFGIGEVDTEVFESLGKKFGITRPGVQQAEVRALKKLRIVTSKDLLEE